LNFRAGNRYTPFHVSEFCSANLLSFVDIVLLNEFEVEVEEIEPYVCEGSLMLIHRLESDSFCYSYMWFIFLL